MFENRIEYAMLGDDNQRSALLKERNAAKRKGKQKPPVTPIPQKPQSLAEAEADAREVTEKLIKETQS